MEKKYHGVVGKIQKLSDEQHRIYLLAAKRELTDGEKKKLGGIKAELQKLWLSRKEERTRFRDPVDEYVEQWYRKTA
jgi:hypothetical protein